MSRRHGFTPVGGLVWHRGHTSHDPLTNDIDLGDIVVPELFAVALTAVAMVAVGRRDLPACGRRSSQHRF